MTKVCCAECVKWDGETKIGGFETEAPSVQEAMSALGEHCLFAGHTWQPDGAALGLGHSPVVVARAPGEVFYVGPPTLFLPA